MEKETKKQYVAPSIKAITIRTERGFEASSKDPDAGNDEVLEEQGGQPQGSFSRW